ncbi:DMT family transporter [Mycetocola spongiae]|uniref:DMT family transporter n=1 Tax=Mycetocola spongiae TaxID=2859226 RepID=UPI001CF58C1C|nr:EamA family transporter [Mycetocola spongiae]UCR88039.1 DMT family transporter [Mycetocola spongiae]
METKWRWIALTALAPIAWGTNYFVTRQVLPAEYPLYGSLLRALPAGLLLLLIARELPRGALWWRAAVLGTLNMGSFFVLIYLAAQLLPTSVASTVMAASPIAMMLCAWALIAERPRLTQLIGAVLGLLGVALLLLTGTGALSPLGIAAAVAAMLFSALGFVLSKRWAAGVRPLPLVAWQLIAASLVIAPCALLIEGAPPALDAPALLGFAYVSLVTTALAYLLWFAGLARLPAGTVGLIGLLNPVTGVLLGTLIAGEILGGRQLAGLALVLGGILLGQWSPRRGPGPRPRARGGDRGRARRGGVSAPGRSAGSPPPGSRAADPRGAPRAPSRR